VELLTIPETARLLKVTPITVRRHIAAGRLPAVRVGKGIRVRKEAVEQFLTPVATRQSDEDSAQPGQGEGGGMQKNQEQAVAPRLTAEERRRGLAALENLKRLQQEMLAERGGMPYSPAWKLINEARDERGRALS
jgi:excisionase family DNA binding protein